MEALIELLKEFDVNNIGWLIVICIIAICVATSYIRSSQASQIEMLLMNKNDEIKRFSFVYIILFFLTGVANYLLTINVLFVAVSFIFFFMALLVSFVLYILRKCEKVTNLYKWIKERNDLFLIMMSTAIFSFTFSAVSGINLISCAILGALVEVFIMAITVLDMKNARSCFSLKINDEKWYVYKRMDDNCLLCGNNRSINDATKMRLVSVEDVVEQGKCFKKDVE